MKTKINLTIEKLISPVTTDHSSAFSAVFEKYSKCKTANELSPHLVRLTNDMDPHLISECGQHAIPIKFLAQHQPTKIKSKRINGSWCCFVFEDDSVIMYDEHMGDWVVETPEPDECSDPCAIFMRNSLFENKKMWVSDDEKITRVYFDLPSQNRMPAIDGVMKSYFDPKTRDVHIVASSVKTPSNYRLSDIDSFVKSAFSGAKTKEKLFEIKESFYSIKFDANIVKVIIESSNGSVHTIFNCDSTKFDNSVDCNVLLLDPPFANNYLRPALFNRNNEFDRVIIFSDGSYISGAIKAAENFKLSVRHNFVWDCVSTHYKIKTDPLSRHKLALLMSDIDSNLVIDDNYRVDGVRLSDVYREQISKTHSESGHSYEKPVNWTEYLIQTFTRGSVYDPFLGTGSFLIGCMNIGRESIHSEIDPVVFDIAIDNAIKNGGVVIDDNR